MGTLDAWSVSWGSLSAATDNVYEGAYSAVNKGTGSKGAGLEQVVAVLPNTAYTLTAYVKTTNSEFCLLGVSGMNRYGGTVQINCTANEYTLYTVNFTTDETVSKINVFLKKWSGTGSAWIDNVRLTVRQASN